MLIIVLMVVFGILGAAVASKKNRSVLGWGLLCALFPLIALIILLCLPALEDEKLELAKQQLALQKQQMQQNEALLGETIECPKCAETIKAKASVCRFCHYEIVSEEQASES